MSIKVDIISGFLGAGKTTLIKKMFEAGFNGQKVVLIENEFGEIGIDGSFLKESGVDIKEINSGCICCSLVGDFAKSMEEVVNKFNPERIIIEPSGVGKLSDIVKAVEDLDIDLKLNIIATVVDGGKCKIYMKNFGEFFNNQVEDAKTIIVSKVENLNDQKIIDVYNLLKDKNPNANIILANLNIVDAPKLLETLEKNVSITKVAQQELEHEYQHGCCGHHHEEGHECCGHHHEEGHECCGHHHGEEHECCGHHHHDHSAEEVFVSYGFETALSYSNEELNNILESFKNEENCGMVLRAKGIIRATDNENWYYFDYVAGDYAINLGSPDFMGRFVVIGSKLNKGNIEKLVLKK